MNLKNVNKIDDGLYIVSASWWGKKEAVDHFVKYAKTHIQFEVNDRPEVVKSIIEKKYLRTIEYNGNKEYLIDNDPSYKNKPVWVYNCE